MNEALIIAEIKNGNKKELADVYKAYRSEFVSWAVRHYQCSPEEARDIYQASIIIFYDNILKERLQTLSGTVKTYLFAIGKNKILELQRSNKKYIHDPEQSQFDAEDVKDVASERKELHLEIIQRCLEKIGDPCRTMLELYYFHGTGLQELAEKLHYKNGDTAKNLKSRCLQRLRELVTTELKNHIR